MKNTTYQALDVFGEPLEKNTFYNDETGTIQLLPEHEDYTSNYTKNKLYLENYHKNNPKDNPMKQYSTFREYIIAEHQDNIQDIAIYGCSGGFNGMIYYEETTELYRLYADELLQVITDYNTEYSTQVSIFGASEQELYNNIVWSAAEIIAADIHYN